MFNFARHAASDLARTSAPPAALPVEAPQPAPPKQAIRTLRLSNFDSQSLAGTDLRVDGCVPSLALAFVSPHLDFRTVARQIQTRLGSGTPLVAVSTAGELSCSPENQEALYCATDGTNPVVVLQLFSPELISAVSLHTVPLHSADIRSTAPVRGADQRVELIRRELANVKPKFDINPVETLALTFIDGLSASETFLMEAVYRDGRFPCLFVGGSAGGKLDFKNTWMFDGSYVRHRDRR